MPWWCRPGVQRQDASPPAWPAAPRRTGQAHRHCALHRRPGLSRRLVRPHYPLDGAARSPAGHRPRLGFRLVPRRGDHGQGHPGRQRRQPDHATTSRSWSRIGVNPPPGRAGCPAGRTRPRDAARGEASRELRTEALPAVFDPLLATQEFAHFEVARATSRPALPRPSWSSRATYRVGHQEQLYIENQAMIAVPRPDGGVTIHGSMQCPYYIHGALQRALKLTATGGHRPGRDRRRLRRQGGVPVDGRPPRRAAGARSANRCA